jgi:very-short-patch-repair endonuclease
VVLLSSPPYEGGVPAASAGGVGLSKIVKSEKENDNKKLPSFRRRGVRASRTGWFSSMLIDTTPMAYKRSKTDIHSLPELKTFRTQLRSNLTPAEASFWNLVKNSRLDGRKFRRQHSVGKYILDFYCPSERLGVELDGQVHFNDAAALYDHERKLFLLRFGIKVIRFENWLVFDEREFVAEKIRSCFGWWEE